MIFLIGNKCDLEAQRDVTYEEARQFAEENGLMFVEASAKTGDGVEEAFLETARKIYQNIQDGSLDLNAAESGVQHKPSSGQGNSSGTTTLSDSDNPKDLCNCWSSLDDSVRCQNYETRFYVMAKELLFWWVNMKVYVQVMLNDSDNVWNTTMTATLRTLALVAMICYVLYPTIFSSTILF